MTRPNVVMIVADDMGFSDLGCYGGEISTPNLDALAGRGVRFTQHYSAGRCWPSRACIMTGQYYPQVPKHAPQGPLPEWGRTLPHYLKPAGYRCYHSGKWHVNQVPGITTHGGSARAGESVPAFICSTRASRWSARSRPRRSVIRSTCRSLMGSSARRRNASAACAKEGSLAPAYSILASSARL